MPYIEHPTGARSLRVHDAAVAAARELLGEGGYPAATVDAVSARSGVSKATLYKHWPTRAAIAAEAFGEWMADALPLPDTGSSRGDLAAHLSHVSAFYGSAPGQVFAQLLAACVTDPEASVYFRRFFLDGRRTAMATLWNRGLERGDVNPEVDAGTATDILTGPLIFRLLAGHLPLTDAESRKLASAALDGLLQDDERKTP